MDIITLLGHKASGKSALVLLLSDALHTEIISADSRQIYRSMDIGTGKDLADLLVKDIKTNIAQLNQLQEPTNSAILWNKREPQKPRGFNHSR